MIFGIQIKSDVDVRRRRADAAAAVVLRFCNWFRSIQIDKFHLMPKQINAESATVSFRRTEKCERTRTRRTRARTMCVHGRWIDALYSLWCSMAYTIYCVVNATYIKNSSDLNLHAKLNWVFDSIGFLFFLCFSLIPAFSLLRSAFHSWFR